MKIYQSKGQIENQIFMINDYPIHSLEGLCVYCYSNWIAFYESHISAKEMMAFIKAFRCTDDIEVKDFEDTWQSKITILIGIMKTMPFYSEKDIDEYAKKLFRYNQAQDDLRYKLKGDYYYGHHKYVEAVKWYELSVKSNYNYKTEQNMGVVYYKLHEKDKAIKHFNSAYEFSKDIEIIYNLIKLYRKYNMFDKALEIILDRIQEEPSLLLYIECGKIYYETEKYDYALVAYYKAYELEGSAQNLVYIIDTMIKSGDYEIALKEVSQLKDKAFDEYVLLSAKIYMHLNKTSEAIEILEENIESIANQDQVYLILARLYRKENKIINGINCINQIRNKESEDVIYEMANIAKKAGNLNDYHNKIAVLINQWKIKLRQNYKRNDNR